MLGERFQVSDSSLLPPDSPKNKNMKTNSIYKIGIFIFGLLLTACGGGGSNNPTPNAMVVEQVVGNNWTLVTAQDVTGSDVKATFYVQSFNPATEGTLTGTVIPNNTAKTGTWTKVSDIALRLTIDGGNIELSNMSTSGNTLSASVSIDAGVGGKNAAFSGTVIYTK